MKLTLSPADQTEMTPFVIDIPDNPQLEPEVVIGRARDCDMQIRKSYISRHHCGIAFDAKTKSVRVRDLGSRNGTFVNDQRVAGFHDVHDGDVLIVGFLSLKVEIAGGSSVWDRVAARHFTAESALPRRMLIRPLGDGQPDSDPRAT